jgi:nucleotide-binding universal stress UspA family protein
MLAGTATILVPTDFSDASELALQAALELARQWGSALEILHVNNAALPLDLTPGAMLPVPPDQAEAIASQKQLLQETAERVRRSGVICRTSTTSGKPHAEILEHAHSVGAGLIAMGTHERSALSGILSKSVAEKVLQRAPCPVLVVPIVPTGAAQTSVEESEDQEPIIVPPLVPSESA